MRLRLSTGTEAAGAAGQAHQPLCPIRLRLGIVVEEADDWRRRSLEASVTSARESTLMNIRHDKDALDLRLGPRQKLGIVIDHEDDLAGAKRLRAKGFHRGDEGLPATIVVGADDDRDVVDRAACPLAHRHPRAYTATQ